MDEAIVVVVVVVAVVVAVVVVAAAVNDPVWTVEVAEREVESRTNQRLDSLLLAEIHPHFDQTCSESLSLPQLPKAILQPSCYRS